MIAIRKLPASGVLILSALLAASCSNPSFPSETTVDGATSTAPSPAAAKQEQKTLLRFINATSGPKDLYFQDVLAFRRVDSQDVTSYLALPSPRADAHHELKLYDSANPVGTPLVTDSEPETDGHRYTVLALEKGGKFTLTVIPDHLKPPAPGKAKLRVIHAAPGADFGRFTEYKEVAPTTEEHVKLEAGKLYTIVWLGGEGKPASAKVIEDELIQ
ncbi:MAG TPA: DUF4397 domain-containing protein [Bryobacteraceae bacterium]|nr:DUF4397 domain-containing protein [Bryobacteraceae bacterium]